MERKPAVIVLKEFFGYKPGQTLKEFNDELKALTPADKQKLAQLAAEALGYELTTPAATASTTTAPTGE